MIESEEQEAFAKFIVEKKQILTDEDIQACLEVQQTLRQHNIEKSLDQVISEKGMLGGKEISQLVREFRGGDEELIRGYRIVSKLGEGAMGEVYKAIDLNSDNRLVAIKILFSHLSKKKSTAQRFLREAEICIKKLDHPNIVKGFDVGYEADKDFYFYVMEYVNGMTLNEALRKKGKFSEELTIKITLQLAAALEEAAKENLVHRDIKPDNVITTAANDAKLCDLGLARDWVNDLSLTRTGAVMGTPFYISPEGATGADELDNRSDIYSLGATIYHLVVGRVPFEGNNSMAVLYLHKTKPIIPPLAHREDISVGLSAIIEMMMAKDPSARYQTPTELIEDLKRLQNGQDPEALKNAPLTKAALPKGPIEGFDFQDTADEIVISQEFDFQETSDAIVTPNAEITDKDDDYSLTTPEILEVSDAARPEILEVSDGTHKEKRQDTVEEYFIETSSSHELPKPKPQVPPTPKETIIKKFFTTSEQQALSDSQFTHKLMFIGGMTLVLIIGIVLLIIRLVSIVF